MEKIPDISINDCGTQSPTWHLDVCPPPPAPLNLYVEILTPNMMALEDFER